MSDDAPAGGGVRARLQAWREATGLSRRALARRAGTTPETIAQAEAGVGPPRAATVGKTDLPAGLRAALALHGIPPGPHGYDVATLAAAIAALGWRYTTEERSPSQRGRRRYRALVVRRGAAASPAHDAGRAGGETEAEALAAALARLLGRQA